ncbi:hypothetical protein PAXRUDRAFT_16130 [Paxillus rubicundulus Ve08.2h10]|uniref:Uncharacterized protein n=1 Tax=Paxillus rubicundulus Ve08.2h10 TaxID=930991 RepID=A0A0D0DMT1_9AGAM|nr:hypothetical protein PAXRUDRAFT_16130 [Paxillus rubicundulus Ve08.2h10]
MWQLSQLEMMMTIRADILEMQMQGRKSNAERFVNSNEFKDILKDRLWACLLSPNLTAYVQDLVVQIFIYAKKNLQTFKIPEAALEDPEMTEKIVVLISQLLTSARLNMKQKRDSMTLFESVVEESSTRTAAQKKCAKSNLRQPGPVTSDDTEENEENQEGAENPVTEPTSKEKAKIWTLSDYWEFVDHVLHELRAEACTAERTPAGHTKHLEVFFTRCFQIDMKTYAGSSGSSFPTIPAFDKVTVQWQQAIHTGLIW